MTRILPTLLLTTTLAVGGVTPAVAADKTGVRAVCAESTYVMHKPGKTVTGTLFKDQKIRVTRYSPSGRWAYGDARGNAKRKGWVKTADLCR
ncbi:hypothetical protein DVA67_015250 [Solirubrobacter sp. CPCC 204708]|uniref:SH3 domain-containing protein n=1 Tax=Solirubrobacter deserti TaxID=2282478 RepID=A0ABT4RKL2_9ACTN|nr:hypothetical protein [Solirubrobacter deserti]MBE2317337.1 hypothetical protein [Solirubrobacter deserti]MDA0139066.1 hypothetical protein [Solirubrobacter deserti]